MKKLEAHLSAEEKHRWKLVRTDNFFDVPGEIVSADEGTGEACMKITAADGASEDKSMSFQPGGFRIVGRSRW